MNIQENIKICNGIAQKLSNLIDEVKSGSLPLNKATSINKLACTSIRATKEGVMMAHHHQIQRDKVLMHQKEIDVKHRHIDLQYAKLGKNEERGNSD